jgi:hypothetical protein
MDMIDNSTRIEGIVCRVNGNSGNNDANNGGEAGLSKMIAIPPFAGASILHQLMIQKENPNSMMMGLQVQQGGGGQGGPPPPPNNNHNQEATGTCMPQQSTSQGNTLNHQAPPFVHHGGLPPPMMMRPPPPPHMFRVGNGNGNINHAPPGFSPHHPHAVSKRNEGNIVMKLSFYCIPLLVNQIYSFIPTPLIFSSYLSSSSSFSFSSCYE